MRLWEVTEKSRSYRANLNLGKQTSKVDQGECQMMKSKTMRHLTVIFDQQRLEFVCPRKGSLTDEAMCIHNGVEIKIASTLDRLPVAFCGSKIGLWVNFP